MSKATIWNPNTTEKKVINVGDAIPTGFSLWTGGTATGQQAQEAIKKAATPVISNIPTPTNPTSSTIDLGIKNSNVSSQLPNSNDAAMKLYTDNSLQDATNKQLELQKNLDTFNAQRIQDNKTQLANEEKNLKDIQTQKDTQVSTYDTQMNPLKDKAVGIYDSMLNSIKDTNYSELTKQKLDLTNDIVSYSKMFSQEITQAELGGGLSSVATNRKNQVIENYTSKIAIAQAASSAIDGNFNLAFDIMDKGANAIQNLTTDRINFINTVQDLFSAKETDSRNKLLSLTSEQSKLLDQAKEDAQVKIDNLQKNKETIMSLMQTNPIIANKAGLILTDTPEVITQKLNTFYTANPQYTPDNQAFIKSAMEKYYDAGITLNDPLSTVQSKIQNSRTYQNETAISSPGVPNQTVTQGVVVDPTGNSYDISSYATDPNHETAVQNLINGMGQFKSVSDIDNYIKSKYPNSPITGQMIYNSAEKFGVSWEAMTAIMEQDSSLGTTGKGARTFNPGNVGNDDSGNIRNYGNWQSGVDAVAQWLSNHKTTTTNNSNISSVTGKPLSQPEILSQTFANRLSEADLVISALENNFTGKLSNLGKYLPDFMKSEDRKRIEQAERNFINAVLRKESGAAISPTEFDSAELQYFPQPGDTIEVIKQKKQNRQTVIDGMKLSGGMYSDGGSKTVNDDDAYKLYLETINKK